MVIFTCKPVTKHSQAIHLNSFLRLLVDCEKTCQLPEAILFPVELADLSVFSHWSVSAIGSDINELLLILTIDCMIID